MFSTDISADACRRELERQRDAIQPVTDLGHRAGVPASDLKARLYRNRAVDEQAHAASDCVRAAMR